MQGKPVSGVKGVQETTHSRPTYRGASNRRVPLNAAEKDTDANHAILTSRNAAVGHIARDISCSGGAAACFMSFPLSIIGATIVLVLRVDLESSNNMGSSSDESP